jgi:phosphoribosylformylglycinamidine synthase
VIDHASKGAPVLGVCNGFQILTEIGLLPGALMRNAGLKFISRNLNIRVEANNSIFTEKYQKGQNLSIPVAHNDGNYFAEKIVLDQLEEENRIAFRYVDSRGEANTNGNPNGPARNIAGILNANRNVLGLMPHPENATDPKLGGTDGRGLFASIVANLS